MKKIILILSICFFIISFIKGWYNDQIFDTLFIFIFIPNLLLMISFNILFIISFIKFIKEKSYVNIISIFVLVLSVILALVFPFRKAKVLYELDKYESPRLEIINMIKTGKLKVKDETRNIVLPDDYKKYSTSGQVYLYQDDKGGEVVGFWVYRGIQSGSVLLIYSADKEDLIKVNETGHPIVKIEKLKDNWFYVITDY